MNLLLLTIFMSASAAVLIVRLCVLRFRFETVDFALASLAYTLIVGGVFVSEVAGGRSVVARFTAAFISLGPAIIEIGLSPTRKKIQRQRAQPPSGPTHPGW